LTGDFGEKAVGSHKSEIGCFPLCESIKGFIKKYSPYLVGNLVNSCCGLKIPPMLFVPTTEFTLRKIKVNNFTSLAINELGHVHDVICALQTSLQLTSKLCPSQLLSIMHKLIGNSLVPLQMSLNKPN